MVSQRHHGVEAGIVGGPICAGVGLKALPPPPA